ncbi:MAG: lipoprotein-releasing ABC transporter permease subunit [Holosporales bacterium]|nr:lipoprotein-releasing ABC transporter permease subunit [Holosporales bacterium]
MIERFIAKRYLRSGKTSGFAYVVTWFSFIGIAIGVATLIIVTSVMNGFRHELLEKIVGMKGHVIIHRSDYSPIDEYGDVITKIKNCKIKEITQIIPQIENQAVIMADGLARGALIHGISPSDIKEKKMVSCNIIAGGLDGFKDNGVLIGRRMAEGFNLRLGNFFKLLIPNSVITPFGKLPKEESFEVVGIFEVGMNEYDKGIIIVPLETAQSFFGVTSKISQIEIFLNDADSVDVVSKRLEKTLGNGFNILDWQHSDATIFHAVVVEKNVMTLILSIIVLVAVFNIISGLTMLTNSKTRDIAILRTIGVTKQSVLKIFFLIGSTVGILGTGIGVIMGLLISLNIDRIKMMLEKLSSSKLFSEEIYFLSQIPSKTDPMEVMYIVAFSLILCFLATIYPARKAARLDPVEALRS